MKNWLLANVLPLLPVHYKVKVLQNSITDGTIGEIKTAMGSKKFLHLLEDTTYSSSEENLRIIENTTTVEERLEFLRDYPGEIDYNIVFIQNILRMIPERRRFEYIPSEKRPEVFLKILQTYSSYLLGKDELQELPHEQLLNLYVQEGTEDLLFAIRGKNILEICTVDEKLTCLREHQESINYGDYSTRNLLESIPITRRFEYIPSEKRHEVFLKILQTYNSSYLLGKDELQELPHDELLKVYFQDGNRTILEVCSDDEKLNYLKSNEETIQYATLNSSRNYLDFCIRDLLYSIPIDRRFEYISAEKRQETLLKVAQVDSYLLGKDELQELPHDELLKLYFQDGNRIILEICTEKEKMDYLKANRLSLYYYNRNAPNFIQSLSLEAQLNLISEKFIISDSEVQLSTERLQILRNVFGDWIVNKVIDDMIQAAMSENMKKLFSMPEEDFNNLIEVFRSSKLTNDNVNTVYNAFVQKMFTKNRGDVVNIFPRLKSMIDTKNEAEMEQILYQICWDFSVSMGFSVDEFLKTKDSEMGLSTQELLSQIGYQVTTPNEVLNAITEICKDMIEEKKIENQDIKMSVIHAFCNYYIKKCREQYMTFYDKDMLLQLPKKVSEEKLIKKAFSTVPSGELFSLFRQVHLEDLDENLRTLLQNEELLRDCIEFKKNPSSSLKIDVRKNLRNFNTLTKMLCSQGLLDSYANIEEMESFIPDTLGKQALEVLEKLDFDRLFANGEFLGMDGKPYIGLFHNPEKLEELKKIFQKYGFLAWDDIFTILAESAQVQEYGSSVVFATFMNRFEAISSEIKAESSHEFLFKALKTAYLRTVDSRLINLLGKEDYELLLKNPGPNSGHKNGEERLKVAESLVPQMYQRESITIPPTNREFETSGGKKLRVVVGDTTSMINLTYGERTGACMRLDGVDEQLFHIALLNPNGFQIRFEDPETGNLVSRITGFRNGNSVFCNQLRCSLMLKYTDEELLEIAKLYAQTLLEQTRDSSYPIQNVFIGPGYAIQGKSFVGITEPMKKIFKEDFQVGYFPTDVDERNAMVLATTASGKEYEELDLGLEKAEKYPVLRGPVITQDVRRLNQLRFIDQKLSGGDLDDVSLLSEEDISQVFTGADWYICIMRDGQVISKILDNIPESKRQIAQEEIKQVMEKLRIRFKEENQVLEEKEESHGFGQK